MNWALIDLVLLKEFKFGAIYPLTVFRDTKLGLTIIHFIPLRA